MKPLITDRRHFFLLEGSDVPIDLIVEPFCENGYRKIQSNESEAICHIVKDDRIVTLYQMRETADKQQVTGTIILGAKELAEARKIQRVGTILAIPFVLYCIATLLLYILPIVTTLLGWLDFIDIVSPITPFLGIGFIIFAIILLLPLSYSTWILPVQNREIARNVLEDLVRIINDTCPNVELQSTETKQQNWPDFRISHGIPEDILLKLQAIENAFPEFGNLEMQLNSVKAQL